ncbi:ATP-dependent nuclease [Jiangella rhizosphaerae]|uniref:Toprim domain-containing protein n=1 Tax=Jiangella rhizosphaerae TaxID=2293569 RepID=A0A418KPT4_9ACTN|nr:AAA family ATPase [Jiangella rhizosphaerae]RIQ21854.1 hypothetical protein DY240_14395 [Jiangella rhizosphaerae]
MRLASVRVNNYRSIQSAESFELSNFTVLVGPNNEGKSNLLRATVLGVDLIKGFARTSQNLQPSVRRLPMSVAGRLHSYRVDPEMRRERDAAYEWERDYPLVLQPKKPGGRTTIRLSFALDENEMAELRDLTGVHLNQTLITQWYLDKKGAEFDILKRGPGKSKLRENAGPIARFISERIDFHSILAIRTHSRARDAVRSLVQAELRLLEDNEEYQAALQKIRELRQPVIDGVQDSLLKALGEFLPSIQGVQIRLTDERTFLVPEDILIDDGVQTSLRDKGDGVQSLAALSLMQHLAIQRSSAATMVLAIEEPEAHLHPDAVHALRSTLRNAADSQQVIVTTHNPIIVNRSEISSNIVVQHNSARPAKRMHEVRSALGVRVFDNLIAAELVVLVEGDHDATALRAILSNRSAEIGQAAKEGRAAFIAMGGASKLAFHLSHLASQVCDAYVLLDYDDEGRNAAETAKSRGILEERDVTFLRAVGMRNSEFEDILNSELYSDLLQNGYGISLTGKFRRARTKWSDRIEGEFVDAGKQWTDETKRKLKAEVAALVASTPSEAVANQNVQLIDKIRSDIELRLRN